MEKAKDNLEVLYLRCPHCTEVSKVDQWVTMAVMTTSCSASFSFMGKPKESSFLICPKCRKECHYQDLLDAMTKDLLASVNLPRKD